VERSLRRALEREGMAETQLQRLVAEVRQTYEAPLPEITEDTLAGNMAKYHRGRICNYSISARRIHGGWRVFLVIA